MKRIHLKDAVLVLLILCSVILALNTWTDSKWWGEYDIISTIKEKFGLTDEYSEFGSLSREKLARPYRIVVNNSAKRSVYFQDSSGFEEIFANIKPVFESALSGDRQESATESEWYQALKTKSLYVTYPVKYHISVISDIFEIKEPKLKINSMDSFVIYADNSSDGFLTVIIKDSSDVYKKCYVTYDVENFKTLLDTNAKSSVGSLPYSFELNFDKAGDSKQKVLIGSEVLLSINPTSYTGLTRNIATVTADGNYNNQVIDNVLKGFGYNSSSIRKYIDNDDVVYVENYGTVRINKSGYIEYKAITGDKGIDLGVSNPKNLIEVYTASLRFVSQFHQTVMPDKEMNVRVSSDVVDMQNTGAFKITLDYYSDGYAIRDDVYVAREDRTMTNAIELSVLSGKVVSYRQILRSYEKTQEKIYNLSTIEAVDVLFADKKFSGGGVKSITPVYTFDENGLCSMTYVAESDSKEKFLLNMKSAN